MNRRDPSSSTKHRRRKTAKQPRRKPSPPPRNSSSEGEYYTVKSIIDEKIQNGKVLYKIDWDGYDPTTGLPWEPTWEPAENVNEAALIDWEQQKHQRQAAEQAWRRQVRENSGESEDGQPVLPPNWRAQRRRSFQEICDKEDDDHDDARSSKRPRQSIDSGYTSSHDGDDNEEFEWTLLKSSPKKKVDFVCELTLPPDFDRSEYRVVSLSSQSVSSSQNPTAPSTIPDSQEWLESLHTLSSATHSNTDIANTNLAEETSRTLQEALQVATIDVNLNHSISEIPSRQLEEPLHPPSPLLDPLHSDHLSPSQPEEASEEHLFNQEPAKNTFSGVFLSQPPLPSSLFADSAQSSEHSSHSFNEGLSQDTRQINSHCTTISRTGLQPAQGVSTLLDSNRGQLLSESLVILDSVGTPALLSTISHPPHLSSISAHVDIAAIASTPQRQIMEPSEQSPPQSAVELIRQIHVQVFGHDSEVSRMFDLTSPSAPLSGSEGFATTFGEGTSSEQVQQSSREHTTPSVEQPNPHMVVGVGVSPADLSHDQGHLNFDQPPQTVAPSDLTSSIDHIHSSHDDFSTGDHPIFDTGAGNNDQNSSPLERRESPEAVSEEQEQGDNQSEDQDAHVGSNEPFIVTLPMAANTRAMYLKTILENKKTMVEFGEVFAESMSQQPAQCLVTEIDRIFETLLNLCDFPAYDESLRHIGTEEIRKHAVNSNSKFSFVYEFLLGVSDLNLRVLIVSQPGRVLDYLEAVSENPELHASVCRLESSRNTKSPAEGLEIILASAIDDFSSLRNIDVVIQFDHVARTARVPPELNYDAMLPVILSLVTTYSLEHLDLRLQEIEPNLSELERKNALNLATGATLEHLQHPQRGYPEPHEAAELFANFLRSPEAGLNWDPQPLPPQFFDIWANSQRRIQEVQDDLQTDPISRKRPRESGDEVTQKRPRLIVERSSYQAVPMTDLLKKTLVNLPPDPGSPTHLIEVPVGQLERLAEKIAELESRLATQASVEDKLREHIQILESQLRSYEKTINTIQPKFMEALRDRANFEKECKAATDKANATAERLEAQKSEIETLKLKLADAQRALENHENPDLVRLAQAEKARDEALSTIEKLEKKLKSTQNELEYSRRAYQDASNAHTELNNENRQLRARITDLEKRANDNLLRIHQTHAQNEARETSRQIDELRATLENRERELDRAMQELRLLKNGRRETRQASVPRSPRTAGPGSVMSPRVPRGSSAVTTVGGAGSRGTSPAPYTVSSSDVTTAANTPIIPGMTYFPPAGASGGGGAGVGRWGHLRD